MQRVFKVNFTDKIYLFRFLKFKTSNQFNDLSNFCAQFEKHHATFIRIKFHTRKKQSPSVQATKSYRSEFFLLSSLSLLTDRI